MSLNAICTIIATIFMIIALILLTFIFYLLCDYRQIGPTCGYTALIYHLFNGSKEERKRRKKELTNLIISDIENKKTNVGEIFNIEDFNSFNDLYPNKKIYVIDFNGTIEELDELLKEYNIIFPLLHKEKTHRTLIAKIRNVKGIEDRGTPHYIALIRNSKRSYYYKDGLFSKIKKIEKQELINLYTELCDMTEYKWDDYYHKPAKISKLNKNVDTFTSKKSNAELYTYVYENIDAKRETLLKEKTISVSMYGKVVIIPK